MDKISWREITPEHVYLSRRKLLGGAAALALPLRAGTKVGPLAQSQFSTSESKTPYKDVTTYNNFYEFGTEKHEPAQRSGNFKTRPWTVAVEGDAAKPRRFDIDEILKLAPLEERIYRMRCVEGWSMVIPWVGFPLAALLRQVEPLSKAKYVAFQTLWDPKQMPVGKFAGIPFPYVEGLRMDEAMHPLTILSVGLYGELLPNQNGAPLRLVVPWKYGFKSIKSIVRIRFVERMPNTAWAVANPSEYGFYSNVNPEVDHPRWSQKTERRIPGLFKNHPTQMFNGYGDQVAQLYAGMDLRKYY